MYDSFNALVSISIWTNSGIFKLITVSKEGETCSLRRLKSSLIFSNDISLTFLYVSSNLISVCGLDSNILICDLYIL